MYDGLTGRRIHSLGLSVDESLAAHVPTTDLCNNLPRSDYNICEAVNHSFSVCPSGALLLEGQSSQARLYR